MLIWWVNQADCEAIGPELPAGLPDYLKEQYAGRLSRPGRGRLWTDVGFHDAKVDPWPDTALGRVLGDKYGGIVIHDMDSDYVRQMPGVVTDCNLVKK